MHNHFRRESLPPASVFYRGQFERIGRFDSKDWATVLCVFHPDHRPSLRINRHTGAFRCFSCGAHGPDIVAFVMLRDGLTFPQAARELGAWNAPELSPPEQERIAQQRLERERTVARAEWERRRRFEIRSWLHRLERLYRQTNARLSDLRSGAVKPSDSGEEERCWAILSTCLNWSRIAARHYARLAGVGDGE